MHIFADSFPINEELIMMIDIIIIQYKYIAKEHIHKTG